MAITQDELNREGDDYAAAFNEDPQPAAADHVRLGGHLAGELEGEQRGRTAGRDLAHGLQDLGLHQPAAHGSGSDDAHSDWHV